MDISTSLSVLWLGEDLSCLHIIDYMGSFGLCQQNGLFLTVDNLTTVTGRKVCNMSKVLQFFLGKV